MLQLLLRIYPSSGVLKLETNQASVLSPKHTTPPPKAWAVSIERGYRKPGLISPSTAGRLKYSFHEHTKNPYRPHSTLSQPSPTIEVGRSEESMSIPVVLVSPSCPLTCFMALATSTEYVRDLDMKQ